jgi:hypothetical protein
VLRAAGDTETTLENICDWLELDGDLDFNLNFPFVCFLGFLGLSFASLIWIIA